MSKGKIKSVHVSRKAVVYLRQSTLKQVHENRESTVRQYSLRERAMALGWRKDAVTVIDEDLGRSGTSVEGREGFQRLAEDVSHGRVGAIFALEVSRFTRSSADWYHLVDLCGWADTLIIDEDGVYSPRDPNDRLLLGLKGQMSDAERYWLKLRMQGAKLSKARRGELALIPPTGYQRDEATGRLRLDPDAQVQSAIRLLFECFRVDGSAAAVRRYFVDRGLKMPARHLATGEVCWVSPRPRTVLDILHSPIFAGAYVYGRRECRTTLVDGHVRRSRIERLPQDEWKVCIKNHHPAYIEWKEYMANQEKLRDNAWASSSPGQRGAPREGGALLQGLVLCGLCGYRMHVGYSGQKGLARYICHSPTMNGSGTGICWSVVAHRIDRMVGELFVQASTPPEVELAFAVAREADQQAEDVDRQWKLRLERIRYEVRLAERRYMAVDPDNRVVAQTLESEWEQKLRKLVDVESDYEEARSARKVDLSAADRAQIFALARDLPRVWNASTTTQSQRKNLLRTLVRQVTLSPVELPKRMTRVQLMWEGGAVSDFMVDRPRGTTRLTPAGTIARLRGLVADGLCDREVAERLNEDGLLTASGLRWTGPAVARIRRRQGQARPDFVPPNSKLPERRDDGLCSVRGVAERFMVPRHTVHQWVSRGLLSPVAGGGRGRPLWFELNAATEQRLAALTAERRRRARHVKPLPQET